MRLKKEDELIYNEKLSEALKEYRKRCNEYDLPPPNWFIEKFNLKRNGEYITAKIWYNIIYKRNDLDSKMSLLRKRNHAILTDLEAGVSHKKICITYNITDDQLNQLVRKRKSPLKKRSLMLLEEVCSLYKDGKSIGARSITKCNTLESSTVLPWENTIITLVPPTALRSCS